MRPPGDPLDAARTCGRGHQARHRRDDFPEARGSPSKRGDIRPHKTQPTRPGLTERREFEYKRQGTLCLIANFDVVTGEAILPTVGPTRTEEDFANHINQTVDTDPNGTWLFVVDQLNTHKSETYAGKPLQV